MLDVVKAKKKPVVVDAVILTERNTDEVAAWCLGTVARIPEPTVLIRTLEGVMRADIGDVVVRGIGGEFYPVKPEIFAQTYDVLR